MEYFRKCGVVYPSFENATDVRLVWVPEEFAVHNAVINIIEEDKSISSNFIIFYVDNHRKLSHQELTDYNHTFRNIVGVSKPYAI